MADKNYETVSRLGKTIGLLVVVILLLTGLTVYLVIPEPSEQVVDEWCGTVDYAEPGMTVLPRKVFNENCSTCHLLQDKTMVGPSFAGLFDRIPSDEWFNMYVTNENSLVSIEDPYTMQLNALDSLNYPHNFSYLTLDDLAELKQLIKNYTQHLP
jgi:hypothetical protein